MLGAVVEGAARMSENPDQSPAGEAFSPALAAELTGGLCCAACGYELRGLTIKGVCPECGLAIQATVLSLVDPRAAEIQPIRSRRSVAAGVNAWSFGAIGAVLMGWAVWGTGLASGLVSERAQERMIAAGAVSLVVSGVGALAVIRPHGRIALRHSIGAAAGVLLYPLAVYLYVQLGAIATAGPGPSLVGAMTGDAPAMPWRVERLAMWLTLATGAWLLRRNLRTLAARSLVLRAERVERQTIGGAVVSVLIAALGDVLGICAAGAGDWGGAMVLVGEVLVGVGAVMLTLAVVGIVVDTVRLTPAILQRPLAMWDVVGEG
jgi:hypothetical protein